MFTQYIFFHLFAFSLPIALYLKWVSCRLYIVGYNEYVVEYIEYIVESCFLISAFLMEYLDYLHLM